MRRPQPDAGDFVRRSSDRALGVVTRRYAHPAAPRAFAVKWPDGLHVLMKWNRDGELEQISPPPCAWDLPPEVLAWLNQPAQENRT